MTNMRKWMNLFESFEEDTDLEDYDSYDISIKPIARKLSESYDNISLKDILIFDKGIKYTDSLYVRTDAGKLCDVNILEITGNHFIVRKTSLRNLINAPKIVIDMIVENNQSLESLEGLPTTIYGELNVYNNPNLKSLKGIEKNSEIENIYLEYSTTLPLLRLMYVKAVDFSSRDNIESDIESILNDHIQHYSDLSKRILHCKIALERAGYESNARLD